MHVLLSVWIVAVAQDVPLEVRYPEAAEVFRCTFDPSWDENFDEWPDGWTRRRGRGYPNYVGIKISHEPAPVGEHCLRIDLDGGSAVAYSPAVKVGPLFSYVLEGYVKTEGLQHDQAFFSLTLLNQQRHRLQTLYSAKVRLTEGWKKIRLGPVSPDSDDVRVAVLGLHVQAGDREDLKAAVLFDDIWLGRLPRLTLKTTSAYNFFTDPKQVEILFGASGFRAQSPRVTFELEDVLGRSLARLERRLSTRLVDTSDELSLEAFTKEPRARTGSTRWKPPISAPGFYRVRATMKGDRRLVQRRQLSLAVVEPRHSPAGGDFGWTLPRGGEPLPLPRLSQLLGQAGINWVKYPLWYEEQGSSEFVERLIAFSERLSAQGIELVGLLHDPPESLRRRYGGYEKLAVGDVFAPGPQIWYPSLEPVMTRLATRVRRWQLGEDGDTSFVGHPDLVGKIAEIKAELDRIGQDVSLGIGWGWIDEPPPAGGREVPWRFLVLSADPPMTHQELATYLDGSGGIAQQRWVVLRPLCRKHYSVETRATDLVRRMIAAKIHGADAVFCPEPFDSDHGLMNADGTPGELFLPWRTAAHVLGNATYLGSIELPQGSPNQIFVRAEDAVMVVWNQEPVEEEIYLGENVRQISLWGESIAPPQREQRQVVRAGRLPCFVTGLSEAIVRWRMGFCFARDRIPSVFGQPHQNSYTVKNPFSRGVGGEATLVTPEVWMIRPQKASFRLAGGEQLEHDFEIKLPYNASSGNHRIRVDFEIQADQPYRFSVYRRMDVGMGEVYIDILTRLNEEGELEVQQRLVNRTDGSVSFRCQLFAPDRRRLKTQVLGFGRGTDVQLYRLLDGKELIGKTLWLRAEELHGLRILNYRFTAEE